MHSLKPQQLQQLGMLLEQQAAAASSSSRASKGRSSGSGRHLSQWAGSGCLLAF